MIAEQKFQKRKIKILTEKMGDYSSHIDAVMHPFVMGYSRELSEKLNKVIIRHIERANNGFKYLPLEEKLERVNKIKPTIDRLAQVNNPNNPHVGIARELAEEAFYKIMGIYSPILNKEYSLVQSNFIN